MPSESKDGLGRSWGVWGDSGDPLSTDLTYEEAVKEVNTLTSQGRSDVYAECSETGDTYEG